MHMFESVQHLSCSKWHALGVYSEITLSIHTHNHPDAATRTCNVVHGVFLLCFRWNDISKITHLYTNDIFSYGRDMQRVNDDDQQDNTVTNSEFMQFVMVFVCR